MDWSKAKNILVFFFLGINVFLFIILNKVYLEEGVSEETIQNAIIALKERNVVLNCKIPTYYKDVEVLLFNDGNTFSYNKTFIDANKKIINDKNIEKNIKGFFYDTNIPVNKFKLDKVTKKEGITKLCLYEKYNGNLIFDNFIEVQINESGKGIIDCKYNKIKGVSSKRKILPAYQILLKNFFKNDKVVISDIKIGYKSYAIESGKEKNCIPVWRITIDDVNKYFKAYNGEEIK